MVKKFIVNPNKIGSKANITEITRKNSVRKLETKKTVMRGNNRAVPLVKGNLHKPRSGNFATKRKASILG